MATRPLRSRLAIAPFALLALVAAACGDDDGGTDAADPPAAEVAPAGATGDATADAAQAEEPEAVTLRFLASGNAGIFPYARSTGVLEERLAEVNATLEWVDGPQAFSANLDAMRAGDINVSQAAVSPVVGALIAGLDFQIFAISEPAKEVRNAGVVATAQSGITSVADLVGKRVAVNPAGHGEYILLKALEEEGIPFDQVERVPIQPPDAAAAFTSGSIDAWSTFGVFFSQAVGVGGKVLTYESDLDSDDVGVVAASREVLEANPAAFQVIVDVYNQLVEESHAEPEKFQNIFEQSGPAFVEGERLQQAIDDTVNTPPSGVASPEGIARVQGVLDLFVEAGVLQESRPVDDVVFDLNAALGTR